MELPMGMETLCSMLPERVATSHVWLSSACSVASVTEELKFTFHLILTNLALNG